MAWHLGYPLSQTLFTNVYIEAILMPPPMSVEDADFVRNRSEQSERDPLLAVLRAYCLGLLKACWYVNERIKFEHYYEVMSQLRSGSCRTKSSPWVGRRLCYKHLPQNPTGPHRQGSNSRRHTGGTSPPPRRQAYG